MRKLFILSTAGMLALLAGCGKDIAGDTLPKEDMNQHGTEKMIFSAMAEGTRAALGPDQLSILWEENDAIGVFDETSDKPGVFTLMSGEGTKSGQFEGEADPTSETYYGMYPYEAAARMDARGTISFTFPKIQTYKESAFDPKAAVMVASSGTTEFIFRNAFSMIKLSVTGDPGDRLQGVTIMSKGAEALSGPAIVDASAADPVLAISGNGTNNYITYDCSADGGLQLGSQAIDLRIIMPANTYANGIDIIFNTNNGVMIMPSKPARVLNRNESLEVPVMNITPGFFDLSTNGGREARETANSYVISPSMIEIYGKHYSFPAGVMGNGATFTDGIFATAAVTASAVELLWQTETDLISSVTLDQGQMKIVLGESAAGGNASLAATESGTIKWSWHLWLPSTEIEDQTYNMASKVLMDRNLGAKTATRPEGARTSVDSHGLVYQWGRKDPFPGLRWQGTASREQNTYKLGSSAAIQSPGASANPADPANAVSSATQWSQFNVDTDAGSTSGQTLSYAIEHPMWFLCLTNTVNYNSWYAYPSQSARQSLWGFSGNASTTKSVFDPCPRGYKIPYRNFWHENTYMVGDNTPSLSLEGAGNVASYGGYTFRINSSGQTAWYPASGRKLPAVTDGQRYFVNANTDGMYFTSHQFDGETADNTGVAATIFGFNGTAAYLRSEVRSSSTAMRGGISISSGASVRCMKDQ